MAQVTQKYLEHLVSQREYEKTAAACAKLLKVMPSFSIHPAVERGDGTIQKNCFSVPQCWRTPAVSSLPA